MVQNLYVQKTYNALIIFKEGLDEPVMLKSRLNVDGCIKRFASAFELFWRFLKEILESKGVSTIKFPKDVLRESYTGDLIHDEQTWLAMLEDRNATSHTYKRSLAEEIFVHLKSYYPLMQKTFDALCIQFNIDKDILEKNRIEMGNQ